MRLMPALAIAAMLLAIAGCVSGVPQAKTPAVPPAVNCTVSANPSNQTPQAGNSTAPENAIADLIVANATGGNGSSVQNGSSNTTAPFSAANSTLKNATRNATGILFGDGAYILFVDDLSIATGEACALLSVDYASNYSVITKLDMCPGESENWIDSGGRVFRIVVLKTAAGYSGSAGWAQVEIFG